MEDINYYLQLVLETYPELSDFLELFKNDTDKKIVILLLSNFNNLEISKILHCSSPKIHWRIKKFIKHKTENYLKS